MKHLRIVVSPVLTCFVRVIPALFLVLCPLTKAYCTYLDPSSLTNVATYHSEGLWDYSDLQGYTWNGQPYSSTNHPTDYQSRLATDINIYSDSNHSNQLYITVSGVINTQGISLIGQPCEDIQLTGISLNLPLYNSSSFLTNPTSASYDYALQGQYVLSGNTRTPIDTTPYFGMDLSNSPTIMFNTVPNSVTGLAGEDHYFYSGYHLNTAVFMLSFDPSINLPNTVDFSDMQIYSVYGYGRQSILATLVQSSTSVPEPSTILLLGFGLLGLVGFKQRKRVTA